MQKINQFLIYEFGAKVRAFMALPENPNLYQLSSAMYPLKPVLAGLADGKPIRLEYSMGNLREALKTLEQIEHIDFLDSDGKFEFGKDWNQQATSWLIGSAKADLARLEHTLAAEFERTATYLVAKTTSFDTETLIDHAADTLTEEVRLVLNESALRDYAAAGRCLGFGLFTASGFHAARATESVMPAYCDVFKGCVGETEKHTWGQMLNALSRFKGEPKPDKSTIAILEQIKNVDRNDLMHPRKTLDLTEAIRLFHLATGVIIAMAMEIHSKGEAVAQGQLFDATGPARVKSIEKQSSQAAE